MYEHAKSQAEASLRCAASNCQTLGRDLEDERKKVQQMENMIHMSPAVDELLRLLNHGGAGTQHDFALLHRENVGQREVIEHLQAALRAREETAEAMSMALEEASTALSQTQQHGDFYNDFIKDYDDDDSVTIITNTQPPFISTS
jgi:antirestriction protein